METFLALLRSWSETHNLIGRNEFGRIWERHVQDSLALLPLLPPAPAPVIDLGSGAGFPGLVIALAEPERPVTLVEAVRRKAGFLTHAAGTLGVKVTVRPARIEAQPPEAFGAVTARALAPLSTLLGLSQRFFGGDTVGLFPKGREAATEVAAAQDAFSFEARLAPGAAAEGAIVVVQNLCAKERTSC